MLTADFAPYHIGSSHVEFDFWPGPKDNLQIVDQELKLKNF